MHSNQAQNFLKAKQRCSSCNAITIFGSLQARICFFLKKEGKYYIHDEYLEHEEKPRECRPNMYITALVTSEVLNLYHRHLSKSN